MRPNYSNILPTLSVNQVTHPADNASGSRLGTINAKNPNLKPWEAHGYDVSLEYYTRQGGVFSAGAFRKDITNFFTNITTLATAEFLDAAGLSHDYLNYQINYPDNTADKVRMSGYELAAQQKVLRNLSVFAKFSANRNIGPREAGGRALPSEWSKPFRDSGIKTIATEGAEGTKLSSGFAPSTLFVAMDRPEICRTAAVSYRTESIDRY